MHEKRGYKRYLADGSISFKTSEETGFIHKAYLDNLSFSGLGMRSQDLIPAGSNIDFELVMTYLDKPLQGKGQIKYSYQPTQLGVTTARLGVEFTGIATDVIEFIIKRTQAQTVSKIKPKTFSKNTDFLPF